ncbi:MAG TPA: DUF4157 domain-containing protein [Rhodanobacter sp.]|nr:DUF4157 domain-containing protein [Rhodanobacter sp.]
MAERSASLAMKPAAALRGHGRLLQRKCACGAHSHGHAECAGCAKRHVVVQPKLVIGANNDPLEAEADRVADQVMAGSTARRDSPTLPRVGSFGSGEATGVAVPHGIDEVLGASCQPLPTGLRREMEQRFGHDFSAVRLHTGEAAARSAHDVAARAYTAGHHIVLGADAPPLRASSGQRLLAHELTHVVQQSAPGVIRRCVNPGKNDPIYDSVGRSIRTKPDYTTLAAPDKAVADGIITDAKKKAGCLYYIGELLALFTTRDKPPAQISVETRAVTVAAAGKEQARVAKPAEAKKLDVEEKASADPARVYVKIKGKFGGGTYEVDRRDPKNIVVRAKVLLRKAGTGTAADIANIKSMEDAIEKAASRPGFSVDVSFVDVADADTFTADVDPSKWEVATNWSGGDPTGFAHELLHMFAYELDRYDYIQSHARNSSMLVADRLHWFAAQLTKPAGFDNPASLMASGPHPLNDDVCRVAGLDVATCVAARQKP